MANSSKDQLLSTYLHVYGAYQPKVIPNQKAFTFISKETGIPQVWKWDEETSQIKQYTDLKDRVLSVHHSPSGDKTVVGMDYKGNEKQQLYLLRKNGEIVEELVISSEHFHQFGGWSPDETKIAFSSNRRHPGYFDVFILDIATKTEELVYKVDGNCTPICWTKDGKSLILSMPDTNIDQSLYVLHAETKESYKLGKEDTLARYQSLQLTKDGMGGILLSDIDRDTLGVYRFSFTEPSKLTELVTVEKWDIEEIKLSPGEKKLAFTVNEGGTSRLGIYDFDTQTYNYIKGVPTGVMQSLSWLCDQELLINVKSAVLPGDVWKINLYNWKTERVTFVGEAEEIQHLWTEPELASFISFDGLEVPYFYYGDKKRSQPVVVYVHGGPESQIRAEFNPVIQFLAANGFAVAAPNVRGSMGYGRNYVKLDDGRKRMDSVADLKWLVKDLVDNKKVDPKKVGIMGRSYGGFMVLAALTHYPDVWAAGVDIVGISHFKTFLENTGPWRRKLREFEYGSLANDTEFFEQIAPLNHTDKISVPLLIFHGRNDTRVPVNEAEQLTADLKGQGKQVDLVIFEDEGHQTEKIENHIHMNTMIVQFMEKYL
ncbi:S9 family peptidase [Virgibacillus oceani]|uniref:Peptidase S9 n=1 Tax=Virgibacillus oceani TaxID=1479511 RepID=A0A917H5L6_9BACI|nr:S9 family peptidase [Virgibacillus oceani]GGG68447.1 peptidase S9 [Virgibacillus oceani]